MSFRDWLINNEFIAGDGDVDKLPPKARAKLEARWKEETQPDNKAEGSSFDQKMDAIEAEAKRVAAIQEATTQACVGHGPEKVAQMRELCKAACEDKSMDLRSFELRLLRARTLMAPLSFAKPESQLNETLLEAAICVNYKLPNVEKVYKPEVLEAASSRFRRGLSLQQLFRIAAERNSGYRGEGYDHEAIWKAAIRPEFGGAQNYDLRMDAAGPSTISVSGILSNVANKFLSQPFNFAEQSWRQVAAIKSAKDFKTMTTYRLDGGAKFQKVAPNGELKHAKLSELTYTNKVDTYGIMLGISRTDYINDDLGAFTGSASILSRGASDALNETIWTEWLDDASFFPTDKSLANYDDGAIDSVLSLAGLQNADAIFAAQTKPDGTPFGVRPRKLLVPRGLQSVAKNLMNSTLVVGQGANAEVVPNGNPWAGMFEVVDSIYLGYTALGGSTTAWYLLADPNDVAALEVAFLFGRDTPYVEAAQFEFNMLGMATRAYMDFGVKKQEYRAAVKLKGAA